MSVFHGRIISYRRYLSIYTDDLNSLRQSLTQQHTHKHNGNLHGQKRPIEDAARKPHINERIADEQL